METDRHYLMVGTFVIAGLLAIALFSIWIARAGDEEKYQHYRIRFAESVSGLDVGGPVKFRGVNVGKIDSIIIDPQDIRLIRVDTSILKTTPIKTNTVASLKLQGITGGVYIDLSGTTPDAADLPGSTDNDMPPEIPSQPSTLNALMDVLPQILDKLSHIGTQADKLFSDHNIASFNDTLDNLQKTSRNVNQLTHGLKDNPSKLIIPEKEKGIPAP